ncbi:MAG: cobalamin-dependent protein [Actinomycetota bacterium]
MASLLLVHPLFLVEQEAEQAAASPYFPLGILYLAAAVRNAGHEVAVFDGTFEADRGAFDAALAATDPDLVGVSAVLPSRAAALDLAARARATGRPVVAGGPDPTAAPAAYLARDGKPGVDVVVHHEGEQTILALLCHLDAGRPLDATTLGCEQGVAFVRDGDVVVMPARPPIDDLDSLPTPARDLIDMDRYLDVWEEAAGYRSLTIATARGCPYGCEWCTDAVHGTGYRQRSPESVAAEMQELSQRYRIDRLRMIDDVDGIEREWLDEWARAASAADAEIPFEALNELSRTDIPLLDVRDSL